MDSIGITPAYTVGDSALYKHNGEVVAGPGLPGIGASGTIFTSNGFATSWKLDTVITIGADYTTSSTTISNSGFAFSGVAGKTYMIEAYMQVTGSTVGGISFGIGSTGNITSPYINVFGNTTSSTAFGYNIPAGDGYLANISINTVSGTGFAKITGTITVNTSGTVNLITAAGLSSDAVTIQHLGSYMHIKQIN